MKKSIFFITLLLLINLHEVYAHAVVTHSSLSDKTVIPGQPTQVELTFNSKIELKLSQVLLVSKGDKKQLLPTKPGNKLGHVLISLPALDMGEYALQLRIFSADGHLSEDLVRFFVK